MRHDLIQDGEKKGFSLKTVDDLAAFEEALHACYVGIILDDNVFYPGNTFTHEQKVELRIEWLKDLGYWPIKNK